MKSNRFLLGFLLFCVISIDPKPGFSAELIVDPLTFSFEDIDAISKYLPVGAQPEDLAGFMKRAQRDSEEVHFLQTEVPEMEPSFFGGSFNILHQDIVVDIDPDTGFMNTWITVTFQMNEDRVDSLPLLFPNTLEVDSLTLDGTTLPIQHSSGTLILNPESPLALDEVYSCSFHAVGNAQCSGGFSSGCHFGSSQLNYITHGEYYPQNPTAILDLFKAKLEVRVPNPIKVAGTGRLIEIYELIDEDKTAFVYNHDFETIFVSFSMGVYEMPSTLEASIPITAFVRNDNLENADTLLDAAVNIVNFYEEFFSIFPFLNLDVVEIHNSFSGGYGPQATIMMLSDVFESTPDTYYYNYLLQLMSHEIAHQWWGNMVSLGSNNSVTLSEGLAEFSSGLFSEKDTLSLSPFINNSMSYMYTVPPDQEIALSSVLLYGSQYYQTLAYDKASSVFNMLRYELGENIFLEGMQSYIDRHAYDAADLEDFFSAMEETSGEDLGWFFDQWFISTGYPRFQMETEPFRGENDTDWYLRVTVKQEGENPFKMNLPISITYDKDRRTEKLEPIPIEGESTTEIYRIEGPVFRVSPDTKRAFLQRTQSGLAGDVNLSGQVDGSDLVDMAVLYQRNIVVSTNNGEFFWPNGSYLPRFDLNSDGKIDESDIELLMNAYGTL